MKTINLEIFKIVVFIEINTKIFNHFFLTTPIVTPCLPVVFVCCPLTFNPQKCLKPLLDLIFLSLSKSSLIFESRVLEAN